MATTNPLLLTLSVNTEAQLYFDELRQLHFPAERNYLKAHLMLFHQLPAGEERIIDDIKAVSQQFGLMPLEITKVVNIGKGVAYKAESGALRDLHKQLQQKWQHWLIPQDRQKLFPHITVQNKVPPREAKLLTEQLSAGFMPFITSGTGLTLWEYQGGPWEFIQQFDFDCV